jgi:hypothetical protein
VNTNSKNLRLLVPKTEKDKGMWVSPDTILSLARQKELKQVMIIGWDENENLFISSSEKEYKDMYWMLESAFDWLRMERHEGSDKD